MSVFSLRRAVLGLACASAVLLAACGSSSVESQLKPNRIIAFGDAFSVVTPGASFTVNDSAINTWLGQIASSYGMTVAPVASGGYVYAQPNARIKLTPDAAGSTTTQTVTQQIDTFLASGVALGDNDIVTINAGISDLVVEMNAVNAGTETSATMVANATQYGKDLGAQVRRLVAAGGKHVVVVGTYNLGVNPWAASLNQSGLLQSASSNFNNAMLVSVADLGANVLYIDAAYYFNLLAGTDHNNYAISNVTGLACSSVDSGAGIGTGTGQVNASKCSPSTLNPAITANSAGVTYDQYLFADNLYFTPIAQRLFGLYAYGRIHLRW
ncbi:GDSL family lipase [Rhodoferax sp. WC2427]|uniref:GDSL family lipase n=1 Tax=Rhodoferax sp. WC2427 TaxID=3234144 RepID=UPI0034674A96